MVRIFTMPEPLQEPVATAINDWTNPQMFTLAERLQDFGLPSEVCVQIEIHALMTWAVRIGILSAEIIERRPANRDWWIKACEDDFDKAAAWYAETYKKAGA